MNKYSIFLKPEFNSDTITQELFSNFFKMNNFEVIKEDTQIRAKKDKIEILYSMKKGIVSCDQELGLETLKKFGQWLKFHTYIEGENQEEY